MGRVIPSWVRKAKAHSSDARGLREGYRSGLEEKLVKQIEAAGLPVLFEQHKIPYVIPQKEHRYTPDFLLPNGIWLEGKGIFDAPDRAKHLYIKAQYPGLDIRFIFSRIKQPITPGSKTTVADWCEKYGYRYAEKVIPPEWFTEPGPTVHPFDIIKAGPFGFVLKKGKG